MNTQRSLVCPGCKKVLELDENQYGSLYRCTCNKQIRIPTLTKLSPFVFPAIVVCSIALLYGLALGVWVVALWATSACVVLSSIGLLGIYQSRNATNVRYSGTWIVVTNLAVALVGLGVHFLIPVSYRTAMSISPVTWIVSVLLGVIIAFLAVVAFEAIGSLFAIRFYNRTLAGDSRSIPTPSLGKAMDFSCKKVLVDLGFGSIYFIVLFLSRGLEEDIVVLVFMMLPLFTLAVFLISAAILASHLPTNYLKAILIVLLSIVVKGSIVAATGLLVIAGDALFS